MSNSKEKNETIPGNSCLVCGEVATNLKRGLCIKHYEQFRRKRDVLTKDAAEAFELLLIENDKLLPKQQGKKFGTDDPFAEYFDTFIAENPSAYKKSSDTVNELLKIADGKVDEEKSKPKRKP